MSSAGRKILVALFVALLAVLITREDLFRLGIFQRLELASLDYRFQQRGVRSLDSTDVVIVEVSDESFKSLPERWPWPRSYYAHLVRNLKAAGARVVAIDIILDATDQSSLRNDDELRAAIRETGIVVLAGKMNPEQTHYVVVRSAENYGNVFFPVDSALGLVNIRNDADGVYRRYSPFWEKIVRTTATTAETVRVPTFGFAVLNKVFSTSRGSVATNEPEAFLFGHRMIPKFDASSFLINFYGPSGTFRRIKFADVIDDETLTTNEEAQSGQETNTFSDPDFGYKTDGTFKNKIVLVGSTTPEDHDLFPVSIAKGAQYGDNLMYGVELHANVIENILRNDFLHKQSTLSDILLTGLLAIGTFFISIGLRGKRSQKHFGLELLAFAVVAVELCLVVFAALILFSKFGFVMTVIGPVVAVLTAYVASTIYQYVLERKQRLMIKEMFSTYVNPAVVDELIANPDKLKIGGERRELTVLFSDIEGFTTLSEQMQSEELVGMLNNYFTVMTEIVITQRGTLDKFLGDAIVAFWGAPVLQSDHAVRTCTSAIQMQQALAQQRQQWHAEGKPEIFARIGINTGEVIVGNMGGSVSGKQTFNYTVIGDNVNIASRLEGVNKVYQTEIIISEATYKFVKEAFLCRELDLIAVKGRSEALRVYELLQPLQTPLDAELKLFLELFSDGLRLYRNRNWNDAEQKFREALTHRNDPTTSIYLERISVFKLNPPPEDWRAVYEVLTK